MKKVGTFFAVLMLLSAIGSCSNSGGDQEPTWQSKWQYAWDHQVTAEGKVTVCAAWDVTPSSAAIQVEQALDLPTGIGLGKRMLKQVC